MENEEINEIKEVRQVLKSDLNMDLIMQQLPMNPEEVYKGSENGDNGEKVIFLLLTKFIYRTKILLVVL